jgi:hypothetical protein
MEALMSKALLLASTFVTCSLVPANAQDIGAACPPAGTVVTAHNTLGAYAITYMGSDPADKTVCVSSREGAGAGPNNGVKLRQIYNWQDITNYVISPDAQQKVRSAFQALTSGRSHEVGYERWESKAGRQAYSWRNSYDWKRIGKATVTIDGRRINADKFQLEIKTTSGGNVDMIWDYIYDPQDHIFLGGHATILSGSTAYTIRDYEVTFIKRP